MGSDAKIGLSRRQLARLERQKIEAENFRWVIQHVGSGASRIATLLLANPVLSYLVAWTVIHALSSGEKPWLDYWTGTQIKLTLGTLAGIYAAAPLAAALLPGLLSMRERPVEVK